ncbi:hypothetical protein KAU37_02630 [Candidatus Bipolaricaulota bacterium]|nr:hypothetical protein [Candidatus Bipolaricaulota bacterium]
MLDQVGFELIRIVVSGGIDFGPYLPVQGPWRTCQRIRNRKRHLQRRPVDFTADIKQIEDRPVAKRGGPLGLRPTRALNASSDRV